MIALIYHAQHIGSVTIPTKEQSQETISQFIAAISENNVQLFFNLLCTYNIELLPGRGKKILDHSCVVDNPFFCSILNSFVMSDQNLFNTKYFPFFLKRIIEIVSPQPQLFESEISELKLYVKEFMSHKSEASFIQNLLILLDMEKIRNNKQILEIIDSFEGILTKTHGPIILANAIQSNLFVLTEWLLAKDVNPYISCDPNRFQLPFAPAFKAGGSEEMKKMLSEWQAKQLYSISEMLHETNFTKNINNFFDFLVKISSQKPEGLKKEVGQIWISLLLHMFYINHVKILLPKEKKLFLNNFFRKFSELETQKTGIITLLKKSRFAKEWEEFKSIPPPTSRFEFSNSSCAIA